MIVGEDGAQLMQNAFIYAHRTNIDLYQRLLKTHLTDQERKFIERRLGEEENALLEIAQRAVQIDCCNAA